MSFTFLRFVIIFFNFRGKNKKFCNLKFKMEDYQFMKISYMMKILET